MEKCSTMYLYVYKGVRSSGFLEGVVQVIVEFLGVDARVFEVQFFRALAK